MKINNELELKEVFDYCKNRLPIMNGYSLEVSQGHIVNESTNDFAIIDGVILAIYKDNQKVASCFGIDADDALLDIYRKLLKLYI